MPLTKIDTKQIADGTDGQIITWAADGTATEVGPGSAGTLLTSAGAGAPPTFESSDAAAMALALGQEITTNGKCI